MINIGVVGTEVTALTTTLKIKLGTYVRFFILYLRNPFKNKIAHILSRRDRGWEGGGKIKIVFKSAKFRDFAG